MLCQSLYLSRSEEYWISFFSTSLIPLVNLQKINSWMNRDRSTFIKKVLSTIIPTKDMEAAPITISMEAAPITISMEAAPITISEQCFR